MNYPHWNNFSPIEPPTFRRRKKQIPDWEELEEEKEEMREPGKR